MLTILAVSAVTVSRNYGSFLESSEPDANDQPNKMPDRLGGDVSLVRIRIDGFTAPHVEHARSAGFDLATERPPVRGFFDLAVPVDRLPELSAMGWEYEVRKDRISLPSPGLQGIRPPSPRIDPEYHSYEEMVQELVSQYQAYPEIALMESLGVSTLEQNVMWGFKISDNVQSNEDEPAVLYVSTHHGCEIIGMEYCLYLIDHLLSNYGIDPAVTRWVDETEIWFVPLFNPDGYWAVYTDLNHEWRKNARDSNNNGVFYEFEDTTWTSNHDGIDLNRNYPFNWGLGGSDDPMNYHYRGAFPFSEEETQSMERLATREMFQMAITFHSWGEVVIYPWGDDWNNEEAPDIPVISAIADTVAYRIPTQDGLETYYPYSGSAAEGYIDNWIYGDLGTICMTLEVNPWPIFVAPGNEIQSICERLFSGTTYLLDRVHGAGVTGIVTDELTGLPLQAEVRLLDYYADYLPPRMSGETGRYYRYLLPWEAYELAFIAEGYDTTRVSGVIAFPDSLTTLNVAMSPTVGIHDKEPAGYINVKTFSMSQNYPNPFNPSTTISFDVPDIEGSRPSVQLTVFDLRGRQVRTLVDGSLDPGKHMVMWDGRNAQGMPVSSGIYFYSLKTDDTRSILKMTMLK